MRLDMDCRLCLLSACPRSRLSLNTFQPVSSRASISQTSQSPTGILWACAQPTHPSGPLPGTEMCFLLAWIVHLNGQKNNWINRTIPNWTGVILVCLKKADDLLNWGYLWSHHMPSSTPTEEELTALFHFHSSRLVQQEMVISSHILHPCLTRVEGKHKRFSSQVMFLTQTTESKSRLFLRFFFPFGFFRIYRITEL